MTGADLSTIGRKPKNDDILEQGIWIKHPVTGLVNYVNHKAHITRLLNDGGVQVSGPESQVPVAFEAQLSTIALLQQENARLKAQLEEAHASTQHNGGSDSPRAAHDSRPSGGKSAVR